MLDNPDSKAQGLTSFVTFRMARAQNKLNAQASYLLKTIAGLSLVEWRIIQLLRLFEGASMSKLATDVQMDKGQLSRKVNAMVQSGLIRATPDERDHRRQVLHLTDKARAISDRMSPIMQRRQQLLTAGLTEDDMATFFRVLDAIDSAAEQRELP